MRMRLKDGKKKVLTLSYDDGVIQDKRLVEILDKNGLKCTFNINTGRYSEGKEDPDWGTMTKESAIKLFKNSGHEVAVHTLTHPFLERIDTVEMMKEILEDRKNIEKDYGVIARGMAYPYGTYNDTVVDVIKKCGICYSRTTLSTNNFNFPQNWLLLNPTCHHNSEKLDKLAEHFVEKPAYAGWAEMFYLWGHSYEFDMNDNWSVIEKFAKYTGGHDHIWYATNIEVYDYVQAYKNLQTSVDKKLIHNPSSLDVWFELDGEELMIKGGETLSL